jgi:hypothetical protein
MRDGIDTLSPTEREVFRIQDFIIEYEMGGLSGYLYNRLPDRDGIVAAVAAMRRHGLPELAALLNEAAELFARYTASNPPTWGETLQWYDPAGRLEVLDEHIRALHDYGLGAAPDSGGT